MSKRKSLPFPRLELRWVKLGEQQYKCLYQIVVAPPDELDIRSNKDNEYGVLNIEGEMNVTTVTGGRGPDYYGKKLNIPFRDGTHIIRDAAVLKLPAFVTYRGHACNVFRDSDGHIEVSDRFRYKKSV